MQIGESQVLSNFLILMGSLSRILNTYKSQVILSSMCVLYVGLFHIPPQLYLKELTQNNIEALGVFEPHCL